MLKTHAEWKGNLHDYLQIGDEVDEDFQDYFLEVLPPATWTASLIQMGEAYSHVGGRATYATLARRDGKWLYVGHCHKGQSTHAG
jgi:hypothetical protein